MNTFAFTQTLQGQQDNMDNKYCEASLARSAFGGSSSEYNYLMKGKQETTETVVSPESAAEAVPKPKRPRTAYNLFFRNQQEKINAMRQYNPNASNTAAAVSVYWKNLPSNKKAVYFQMATEDKFRYYKEKQEYETYLERLKETIQAEAEKADPEASAPEDWLVPAEVVVIRDDNDGKAHVEVDAPPYSLQAIALLASKLDQMSIDFLIKALKWMPSCKSNTIH